MERVGVFVDYQNACMGARKSFHDHGAPSQEGQFNPFELANLLASRSKDPRRLEGVHLLALGLSDLGWLGFARQRRANAIDNAGYGMMKWEAKRESRVLSAIG